MGLLLGIVLALVFLILSLSLTIISPDYAKAQQLDNSIDPNQRIKDFKDGKDTLQNDLATKFGNLLNVIKAQVNFSSVDSSLSLASQYFAQGKLSEGQLECKRPVANGKIQL